jgi:hypothetical protein
MYRYTVTALAFVVTAMAAEAGTTTVTDAGAKNLGSSAAYVATCEKEGLLATGTLADFIFEVQQTLTREHWQKVKTQYQTSLHEKKQYTIAKDKWIPFRINSESCSDLGKALPMVRAALLKHSR